MEYLRITEENIDNEHICCAMSNNQSVQKKRWMKERFLDGLVFYRSEQRGKCFIEYMPADNAWHPIEAEGYMHINCLWVSGALKGHGYSNDLLEECRNDAVSKGFIGLTILSSEKKKGFLADPKYLKYKGFSVSDEADNGIQLWFLPFFANAQHPVFLECAKHPHINEAGYVLYYTNQCPFNAKYVPVIEQTAKEHGIPFRAVHIESMEEARSAPTPITTYALFCNGKYLTNEQMNAARFLKLIEQ